MVSLLFLFVDTGMAGGWAVLFKPGAMIVFPFSVQKVVKIASSH